MDGLLEGEKLRRPRKLNAPIMGMPVGNTDHMHMHPNPHMAEVTMEEEGEIRLDVLVRAQDEVLRLHPVLQERVGGGRQNPSSHVHGQGQPQQAEYGLNEEQTKMLQKAITEAADAALKQAEEEARMEEEELEDGGEGEEWDDDGMDAEQDTG